MNKKLMFTTLKIVIAVGFYWALITVIDDRTIVLIGLGVIAIGFIAYGLIFGGNDVDVLEITCDTDKHLSEIDKYRSNQINRYNLARTYNFLYQGRYKEAKDLYKLLDLSEFKSNKHRNYVSKAIELKLAYEDGILADYVLVYNKVIGDSVFEKVNLDPDIFKPHLLILQKNYEEAQELLTYLIPRTKKRILIIELEYLLAKCYFELNRLDDCNAVLQFIIEKDYNNVYTGLSKEMYNSINRIEE